MTIDEQLAYLTKGCVDVVRGAELRTKLQRAATAGQPLVVKVGFDPTAPDLHLGHTVLIRKMKHFQDLGHTVVFLIGDFTGLIGDPTGRSKTRPPLSRAEIEANADTYRQQVFKLLDPGRTVVDFNSRWLGALGSEGVVRLAARYNVAQMLERRDFKQRYESGQPIAVHEFLYPLAQAYDSVALRADVELGGTDQLFNLNVGRDIMPSYDLEPQVVMTVPLLVGLDGVEKMSKSYGNYVGVTEPPDEMFGKLMSISDELMWKYYELLTDLSVADIRRRRDEVESGTLHPKRAKVDLAKLVVTDFHSAADAAAAAERFERRFARRELPEEVPEILVVRGQTLQQIILGHGLYTPEQPDTAEQPARVMRHGLAESGSDASRKVTQGGVRVDREKRTSPREPLELMGGSFILQVGRQIRRAVLADPGDFVVLRHGVAADPAMEPWIVWQVATEGLTQLDAYSHRPHAEARARELAAHAKTTAWSWADGRVTRLGSG